MKCSSASSRSSVSMQSTWISMSSSCKCPVRFEGQMMKART